MRIAAISDVHANLPALEAVLADIDGHDCDELWMLGDAVGYGAFPDECTRLLRDRAAVALAGNHDLAIVLREAPAQFRDDLLRDLRWQSEQLSADAYVWLRSLRAWQETEPAFLAHGSPEDPVWEYLRQPARMAQMLRLVRQRMLLVGHSHQQFAFSFKEGARVGPARPGQDGWFPLHACHGLRWVMNPGSVGQPRDGDPRAAWLLLDLKLDRGQFRRVSYDIDRAATRIVDCGLTPFFAARLYEGA